MDTFVWDENFHTGIGQVDEQHRGLVELFNELSHSLFLSSTDGTAVLEESFARLLDYTNYHFEDEERLMEQAGLDARHVTLHRETHAAFVRQVHSLWARRHEMRNPGETFIGFLTSWLGLHILGMDHSMARQMASVAKGQSAQHAYEQEMRGQGQDTLALLKMISNLYHVLTLQNEELVAANARLEERVAERTRELAKANEELHKVNLELEAHSRTDGLLQIANRAYFDERLADASASCRRRKSPLGLLMIDVDFFKRYNDTYGHQAGDEALRSVARAVSGAVQRSVDLVARYGGEELAVLLPDTDRAGVMVVGERIVSAVAALALTHERSDVATHVTVSIGGASVTPLDARSSVSLLAHADAALYRAKQNGRNRCILAD